MTGSPPSDSGRRERLTAAQRSLLERRVRRVLDASAGGEAAPALRTAIPALEWLGDRPLSYAQEGLYYMHRLTGGSPAFNRPLALRLRGRLDIPVLAWALGQVAADHDALRSVFAVAGGAPVSRVAAASPSEAEPLPVDDLSPLPPAERVMEARSRVETAARMRFDLHRGPLRRFGLLRLDADDHVLWGVIHHIAFDAWSAAIFHQELAAHYAVLTTGEAAAPNLRRPPIQYADYAAWQRRALAGPALEASLEFWAEQLSGLPEDLLGLSGAVGGEVDRQLQQNWGSGGAVGREADRQLQQDWASGGAVGREADRQMQKDWASGGAVGREADRQLQQDWASGGGERFLFTLPAEQAERLRVFSAAEAATPFMALLAVYAALLRREFGAVDLPIGVPVAGRRRPELERMIGLFVNMLVFRCDVSGGPSYRELLRRTAGMAQAALEHQEMPFDLLVSRLRPTRRPGLSPLFQTVFNYRGIPSRPITPGLPPNEAFDFDPGSAQYALDLEFTPRARDLDGAMVYQPEFFDRRQIEALAQEYRRLLAFALDHPDWPLVERPLAAAHLAASNRAAPGIGLQSDPQAQWNLTRTDYPRHKGVVEIFRLAAATHTQAEALIYADARLTYAELDERSDRLAQALIALGVRSEAPVGLRLERSAGMVVAMLAALKAGGAYLPLDPSYPAERLAYMIADSGVRVIVTRGAWQAPEGVQPLDISALLPSLNGSAAVNESQPPDFIAAAGDGASLAYIMYTSGSTGRPKGIEIPQRGIVRLVKGSDYLQVQPGERVAQGSNMSFDAATLEVWGALLNGATLVGLEPEVLMTPRRLAEALRERQVDHLFLTTALFNQVAAACPQAFSGLKTLMFGGEAANPEAARRVLAAAGPQRLINLYGPTEVTVVGTWHAVKEVTPGAHSLPIGKPIANTTAYVLDEALQPVPIGAAGELFLGGDGLARGYLRRPRLTAERFIPNPFGAPLDDENGENRLYRTGDRVRRLEDGSLDYLGRVDAQLKLRGFRIEPGEIETVLNAHPQVAAAAVGMQERLGEKRLVGYVVWNAIPSASPASPEMQPPMGHAERVSALRAHLHRRLPEFMVPAGWVFLETLPIDPNGKLDRLALERLPADEVAASNARPPQSALEQVLAGLWAEALGRSQVSLDDSFFELGGHSLLAIRVMSRVQDLLQVEAPLSLFYAAATLEEFTRRLALQAQAAQPALDLERIAGLILSLSALSDAEVEALLVQKGAGTQPPPE